MNMRMMLTAAVTLGVFSATATQFADRWLFMQLNFSKDRHLQYDKPMPDNEGGFHHRKHGSRVRGLGNGLEKPHSLSFQ